MSSTQTFQGTLVEVYNPEQKPIIELMKMVLNENSIEYDKTDDDDIIEDIFCDNFYGEYVVIKKQNRMFRVYNKKELSEQSIFEASPNPDRTYNFLVQYYNGGCSFDEAITKALEKTEGK